MSFVGIIKANQIQYNEYDLMHTNFTDEKIHNQLDELITMEKINSNDELMQCIFKTLFSSISQNSEKPERSDNLDDIYKNFAIHTGNVSHAYNDLYQICNLYITKEMFEEMKNTNLKVKYNGACSFLSDIKMPIFGDAVIFKIDTFNNNNKLIDITKEDIISQYKQKFVHKGIVVSQNGNIE